MSATWLFCEGQYSMKLRMYTPELEFLNLNHSTAIFWCVTLCSSLISLFQFSHLQNEVTNVTRVVIMIKWVHLSDVLRPVYDTVHTVCVSAKSLQLCQTLCDPMDCSQPGSSVWGFSRQEYWNGLPCPPPGDLHEPGLEPGSPALKADFFTTELSRKPSTYCICVYYFYSSIILIKYNGCLKNKSNFYYWCLVAAQHCINFCCTTKWLSYIYIYIFFP